MSFVARAFTPSQGAPPGSAANPLPLPPGTQTDPAGNIHLPSSSTGTQPAAAAPVPPTAPAAPASPQQFAPGSAPAAAQRAKISATTLLGSAATASQLAGPGSGRKTVLG